MRTKSMLTKLAGSTCLALGFLVLSAPADALNEPVAPDPVFQDTQFLNSGPLKFAFFGGWGGRGDDTDTAPDDDLTVDDTSDDDEDDDRGGGKGGFWGGHGGGKGDDIVDDAADDVCGGQCGDDETQDDVDDDRGGRHGGFWGGRRGGKGDDVDDTGPI